MRAESDKHPNGERKDTGTEMEERHVGSLRKSNRYAGVMGDLSCLVLATVSTSHGFHAQPGQTPKRLTRWNPVVRDHESGWLDSFGGVSKR